MEDEPQVYTSMQIPIDQSAAAITRNGCCAITGHYQTIIARRERITRGRPERDTIIREYKGIGILSVSTRSVAS